MSYRRNDGGPPDALVIVPPPSPSETNPPLGPAILGGSAAEHGLSMVVHDLNIAYINKCSGRVPNRRAHTLGDHGKDRALLAAAAERFFSDTGLRTQPALHVPDTADQAAGMHVDFDALAAVVNHAIDDRSPWSSWLSGQIFDGYPKPPPVVGISIMGPSQVFLAAVILAMVKRRWPETTTVLGGSHVTLLAREITSDGRYRNDVDVVLPGHSEEAFCRLVNSVARPHRGPLGDEPTDFSYLPRFDSDHLTMFGSDLLTIPLQFTRGCAYARCTFCTYPVVEPHLTGFDVDRAQHAIAALVDRHGITRFSIKDSLFTVPMMLALAEILIEKGPTVRWSATTKATRTLVQHAPRLAEGGLATLEIGVETIHPAGQALFDKRADRMMLEEVLLACAESGITVVVNLIFGLPGETVEQADRQLSWFLDLRRQAPRGRIDGSLNMLEIVRGSPLVQRPPAGVELFGVAPWAYCHNWNSPPWRASYVEELRRAEMLS